MSTGITDVEWLDAKVCELSDALKVERGRCAKIAENMADNSGTAAYEYDGGSGEGGYRKACHDIAAAIRCDCGATFTGKWADKHAPTCPALTNLI